MLCSALSHFYVIMTHHVIALLSRSSLLCIAPSGLDTESPGMICGH
jgi:hypothetical protein